MVSNESKFFFNSNRCRNLSEYMKIAEKVKEFFHHEGIHSTTIQPEFVEIESYNSYSGSDGISTSLNVSGTQEGCALDCPTTDDSNCVKATCCQNNNKVRYDNFFYYQLRIFNFFCSAFFGCLPLFVPHLLN